MEIKNAGQVDYYARLQMERTEAGKTETRAANTQDTAAPKGDTVRVSEQGALRTEAYRTAMGAPDIRQDKVDAIKAQLDNGTYTIDSRRIAANLLRDDAAVQQ